MMMIIILFFNLHDEMKTVVVANILHEARIIIITRCYAKALFLKDSVRGVYSEHKRRWSVCTESQADLSLLSTYITCKLCSHDSVPISKG